MAHYAFLNENNIVIEVITGIDEKETIEGLDTETWYGNFRGLNCKRTSYNAKIRGKYAGLGDSYNANEDIFIAPRPYLSWIRDGSYWNAPIPYPTDEKLYIWDELKLNWVLYDFKS
jgi:hypothetical protein